MSSPSGLIPSSPVTECDPPGQGFPPKVSRGWLGFGGLAYTRKRLGLRVVWGSAAYVSLVRLCQVVRRCQRAPGTRGPLVLKLRCLVGDPLSIRGRGAEGGGLFWFCFSRPTRRPTAQKRPFCSSVWSWRVTRPEVERGTRNFVLPFDCSLLDARPYLDSEIRVREAENRLKSTCVCL